MYRAPTDTRKILSEKRLETLQKKSGKFKLLGKNKGTL